ncbi:unnamed protein product, partial [Adineta steineri]
MLTEETSATSNNTSTTGKTPSTAASPAEVQQFTSYLLRVVPLAADLNSTNETDEFKRALDEKPTAIDGIRRFLSDPQCIVFFIRIIQQGKDEEPDGVEGVEANGSNSVQFEFSTETTYAAQKGISVALIKITPTIDMDKKISQQIHLATFTNRAPAEVFRTFLSQAMTPYLKSFLRQQKERDREKSIVVLEEKLNELEANLLQMNQTVSIPDVILTPHASVAQVLRECKEKNQRPNGDLFREKVEDSNFLNQLQATVNRWIREIQKVTKLERDPSTGSAMQEITFWLNIERALYKIQEQMTSPEVLLTLDALKIGKRFHATISFDSDTGLKEALDKVKNYNILMKDFPMHDLLSANDLPKIKNSITVIFNHLKRVRNTRYPVNRILRFIEAISRDLNVQMTKILSTVHLIEIPIMNFDQILNECMEIFSLWDEEYEKFQILLRDMTKKNASNAQQLKQAWKITPEHKKLQTRLEHIKQFRRQHEQFRSVIERLLSKQQNQQQIVDPSVSTVQIVDQSDSTAVEEIQQAFESLKHIDILECSPEGTQLWNDTMKIYEERIEKVERRITSRLREQLAKARNANEMFQIFARFHDLLIRQHIRNAIREYQTQLIQRVKIDIDQLHEKFKAKYSASKAMKMSRITVDIPVTTGSIIWAKQIEKQLLRYLKRVEDVLGTGWEQHVDGQRLKFEGDSFKQRLNTTAIFEDWLEKVSKKSMSVTGSIFSLETLRSTKGTLLRLKVNFTPEIIMLTKEVRNLKWLGYRVPLPLVNKAHQANQLYPYAVGLLENVRAYEVSNAKIIADHGQDYLVGSMKKDIQNLIVEGTKLTWESYKLEPYVQRCIEAFTRYNENVDEILRLDNLMFTHINELDICPYEIDMFAESLEQTQKIVDEFCLHDYSNFPKWIGVIDEKIERKLFDRLQAAITLWKQALIRHEKGKARDKKRMRLKKVVLEIRVVNQMLVLVPPFESAREQLYNSFFDCQSVITSQKRIKNSRYHVNAEIDTEEEDLIYNDLFTKFPEESNASIGEAYDTIEQLITEAETYFQGWLKYQVLWDLEPNDVFQRLGTNVQSWFECLKDIKESRKTLDTNEAYKSFGPLIIDFSKIQTKIGVKYDNWHQDLLRKFGQIIQTVANDFHTNISEHRNNLETKSLEPGTLDDSVQLMDTIETVRETQIDNEMKIKQLLEAQRLLERQRYSFPENWISVDTIKNSWTSMNDVLKQKERVMETKLDTIQEKVKVEAQTIDTKTKELLEDWSTKKPIGGDLKPRDAIRQLALYETKLNEQLEKRTVLNKAKQSVKMQESGQVDHFEKRIRADLAELEEIRNVWKSLENVCNRLEELKDIQWLTVQPKKLKTNLEELLTSMTAMVSSVKNYHSYGAVKTNIENYLKMIPFINELKSEALKDRHWKDMVKILDLTMTWNNMADLTLRDIWDQVDNFKKNENVLRDIMINAQGEKALEEFLKQISEQWKVYQLELIDYQKKWKVIKSWDDLFTKSKENLSNILSMKLSPYFKAFEAETLSWEDKLNRIINIFDIWIDVQRRWVYLEGIFTSSTDIAQLLPNESQKFQSVANEFVGLLKKVEKSPLVLDVIAIPNVQKLLERLADSLTKIQKALGEYLERQRAAFPRFYFIGDEDLLEMIGNSNNLIRLQKHFKKMFAGVNSLIINEEDPTIIEGVQSKEGEEVKFFNQISIKQHPNINDWLSRVEKEISLTLAKLLAQSIPQLTAIQNNLTDTQGFINWLDQYQAQLVVLAFQVSWSENIERLLVFGKNVDLQPALRQIESTLGMLADLVLADQPTVRRRKLEHLIIEHVHKRDVTRALIDKKVDSASNFEWLAQMRLYFEPSNQNVLEQLKLRMANAEFHYGFEYLGLQDRLVQTPLTDRCFLTMTQALHAKFGGSPFGPAGTGKTESVKALGNALGRFVLVFNCDEAFDFQAMGRIFVGLCQVGAWGCFDEFNRLEERMLSAVSQQIQTIQEALRQQSSANKSTLKIEIVGKTITVNSNMAIFITMNPGYAGRSNLPDNLKSLFRSLAMTVPDKVLIAQVMLYSQGFRDAEILSKKIVPLFTLLSEQLSNQSHYDFGLRSLKSVLVMAGNIKREKIKNNTQDEDEQE